MFEFLTQSIWAYRIGWMLIHSLWQFAVVALLVLAFLWVLRRASATARYWTLLGTMCIMVVMPIATCLFMNFDDSPTVASTVANHIDSPEQPGETLSEQYIPRQRQQGRMVAEMKMETTEESIPQPTMELQPERPRSSPSSEAALGASSFLLQEYIQPWLPTIVLIWFAGVFMAAMRPLLSWQTVRRLRTRGALPVEESVRQALERTAKRLKFDRTVEVLQSTLVKTPMVIGYFRPVILLPLSVMTGLPESQLELILAHELAHIRRHDYLINLLQTLAETLFFYHPAMWWLSRQIRNERENCCDDVAMVSMGNRLEYGKALLAVVELRETTTTLSLAASGGSLLERMRRITGCEQGPRIISGGSILCVLLVLIAMFAAGTWAADPKTDQPAMTAEAFSKLPNDKQHTILVEAFEKHLEDGKNLFYETEQISQSFQNRNGKSAKSGKKFSYFRILYQYWRLGDSYKREDFSYNDPKAVEPRSYSAVSENAKEGITRNVSHYTNQDGEKQKNGQVVFPHKQKSEDFFHTFPSPDDLNSCSQWRFFQYLVDSKDKFEIQALVSDDKVQLTIPWHGSKQVFLLDPKKDFLPIGFKAKMKFPATEYRESFVFETKFDVLESRLIDGVWIPVKMTKHFSKNKELKNLTETNLLRSEVGQVKPADLVLPFTKGMQIQDVIEGITYTADAEGKATKVKDAPSWKHDPPEGWRKGKVDEANSLASKISDEDRKKLEAYREAKSKPIDEALAVLKADPPASQNERIEAALKMFRAYRVGEREDDWAVAIRDLITIGKPAVPRLIEELDKTDSDKTIRALGFVLRGIDDPRAIPALIRAIPRLIQPSSNDYGLTIKNDPELLKFMWMHDNDHIKKKGPPPQSHFGMTTFSYGRSIREIMPTLQKLTGKSLNWRRMNSSSTKLNDINQLRNQRTLFLNHAKKWADWWSKNWQNFVDNEADAQLVLNEKSLRQVAQAIAEMPQLAIPTKIPCGPTVKIGGEMSYHSFERYFNLDISSKTPRPKELFKKSPKDKPSAELLAWARRNGIDLLRIEIKRPDDEKTYYGYQPVDMKVWKIENRRVKNLEKELQKSKDLDLPLWKGPLSSVDKMEGEIDEKQQASFLFITKQGACGVIQIRSGVSGNVGSSSIMGMRPRAFSYWFIYRSLEKPSKTDSKKPEPWEISKRYKPAFLRYQFLHHERLPEPIVVPAVKGVVVDPSGKPAPNVVVVSYTPRHVVQITKGGVLKPHQHGPTTKTNSQGRFSIPERKEPYRVLVASEQGIASLTHEELIYAKGKITLKPWSRIEGTFILEGKPQANQRILYYPDILPWAYSRHSPHPQFDDYHTTTDEKGRFVIDHAPPLSGRLYGTVNGRRANCQVFSCEPGKTTHVELGIGRTLFGQLQTSPEKDKDESVKWEGTVAIQGATLPLPLPDHISKTDTKAVEQWLQEWNKTAAGQAFQDRNNFLMNLFYSGKIKSNGSFRIAGVPAGKYIIRIYTKEKHSFQTKELVVDSDTGLPINLGKITPTN